MGGAEKEAGAGAASPAGSLSGALGSSFQPRDSQDARTSGRFVTGLISDSLAFGRALMKNYVCAPVHPIRHVQRRPAPDLRSQTLHH